jgi:LysR family transcriptional regulator for bpeEF and oprC
MGAFSGIEAFVHTAERGSFRGAAARLGVTPAATSKAVRALEERLGVRLLERTSRRVALTPEGEVFLGHCRGALDQLDAGFDAVLESRAAVRGTLRVSLSPVLSEATAVALPRLLSRHPGLDLELRFDDRRVRLIDDAIDVAVRIGPLDDSELLRRRLATLRWTTVASPRYLASAPPLRRPADLAEHRCLRFLGPDGRPRAWRFERDGPVEPPPLQGPRLGLGRALVDGAVAGLGVAQVFRFAAAAPLADGRLVEVLPGWAAPGPELSALLLPGRRGNPRVQAFVAFLGDVFGG